MSDAELFAPDDLEPTPPGMRRRLTRSWLVLAALLAAGRAAPALAQDRLCDPGGEDCGAILMNYIRNEQVAIDVAFWFIEDGRYTAELVRKHQAGVPVRVLMDTRANSSYPLNAELLDQLRRGGIPMRRRLTSYILHWKMMLFHGQNVVEFSGANYSANAWRPLAPQSYSNYIDEAIYFTSDASIVNSFRTRFDAEWVDTDAWANYANVSSLARRYPVSAIDPELNFPPSQNYRTRAIRHYDAETRAIDVFMYRITDRQHTDRMLAAVARGVPVRLITEPMQYRDPARLWHSWNVDRLYMGGVQIRHRAHQGLAHQKSVILRGQNMVIFGSSNWTSPSAGGQLEHNLFTTKPYFLSWFVDQFERKWNNGAGVAETGPFVPLPPDVPAAPSPADGATGLGSAVTLKWHGGPWAHVYDVYFGTSATPPLVASNLPLGPSERASQMQSYTVTVAPGRTYYWRIVAKTMAMQEKAGPVWRFTAGGTALAGRTGGTDYDGDGLNDLSVFRPSSGQWLLRNSSVQFASGPALTFGLPTDRPVPGDYDGDALTDLAVYRPSTGAWYVIYSSTGAVLPLQFGLPGDRPMPADFTGDGRTDLAVWRPSNGVWYILDLATGAFTTRQWGLRTDVPLTGDFDGDGKADVAAFRPSNGYWYVFSSSTQRYSVHQWGIGSDIPVPADYTGDRRTDLAVYRPSTGVWYVYDLARASYVSHQWGVPGDVPAPKDYDGDRRADLAVWRPSTGTFFIYFLGTKTYTSVQVGVAGDVPIR